LADVVCLTLPTNRASQRVMEKAGFGYERDVVHTGLPHVLYRITATGRKTVIAQKKSQYPNTATQTRIARTIRVFVAVEDTTHRPLTYLPSLLSRTSSRSKKRARSKNSPASIQNPRTIIM
jgi:hypothetical protein